MELLQASNKHYYSYKGRVLDQRTSPDNSTRQKTLEFITELYGYRRNASIENVNIGIIQIPSDASSESWNETEVTQAEVVEPASEVSHNNATTDHGPGSASTVSKP